MRAFAFLALCSILSPLLWAQDPFEPDDEREMANILAGSEIVLGHTLHEELDIDWFTFTIEDGRVLRLIARAGFELMHFTLYDSGANELRSSDRITIDLDPGTYLFSIEVPREPNDPGETSYNYTLFFTLSPYSPDASEPNDDSTSATPLPQGELKYLQSIAPAGDVDYYVFEVGGEKQPTASEYVIETNVSVFDALGVEIPIDTARDEPNRALVSLATGVHTIRVTTRGGDFIVPTYGITAWPTSSPDPFEVDDTPEDATLIMVDGPRQTHNFTNEADEDWYLLLANTSDDMTIASDLNVDLTLFAADAESVLSGPDAGEITQVLPGAGVYYIRATSNQVSPTPDNSVYTMKVFLNNEGLNVVGTLTGVINEDRKARAISGVEVALTGTLRARTFTDSDGIFVFPLLTQGTYSIRASADDYFSDDRTVELGGGVTIANFDLAPLVPRDDEDIDGDGIVNSIDIQFVINVVLGITDIFVGDVNNDGSANASDIQLVINKVLGV